MKLIKELYAYREMIVSLVKRELRGRYKGSILGFAWTFINPLLQLMVYTIVFSRILKSPIEDYYLFLFVALIPWLFFSSSISAGCGCIRAQGNMIKKIYFPRIIIPLSFVTSQFINMLFSMIVVFIVLIVSGKGIFFKGLLVLPFIMLIEYAITLGLTLLASAIVVYFRDMEHFIPIITMVWQYLTPIMYDINVVPSEYLKLFYLNPMTSIIIAYRDILYYQRMPQFNTLILAIVFAFLSLSIGLYVFSKLQRHFAEEL